jgi:hypothetical protein
MTDPRELLRSCEDTQMSQVLIKPDAIKRLVAELPYKTHLTVGGKPACGDPRVRGYALVADPEYVTCERCGHAA